MAINAETFPKPYLIWQSMRKWRGIWHSYIIMHGQFMTSKYGWIDKLGTYHGVLISWNSISCPLVPEIIITLGDITRDHGPFIHPSDLPFVGVGKMVREWDDQSGGQTQLDLQEGIAGNSTGMAFAGRQTASLYTCAPNILPLVAVSYP